MNHFVSVIVPAFNAAKTISVTLASALAQREVEFEIIVVDDGSTDDTGEIVGEIAGRDRRVALIRQANGGVAQARNRAIAEAAGDLIAPLDADDVWHPNKLRLQMDRMDAAGAATGLVYNWFRRIDGEGRVIPVSPAPCVEGWVFHQHLDWNFISNGSTPLIRRGALDRLCYDPLMREGCEDYLLQLQIAQEWRFAQVPAYLTGYRRLAGTMSTEVEKMIRGHMQMYEIILADSPTSARPIIRRQMARLHAELARARLRRQDGKAALTHLAQAAQHSPGTAFATILSTLRQLRDRHPTFRPAQGRHFDVYGTEAPDGNWATHRTRAAIEKVEALDVEWAGFRDGHADV